MQSTEYAVHVRRTQNPDLTQDQRTLNFALGLSNEMLEAIDARNTAPTVLFDELGDVAWYACALADTLFCVDVWRLENEPFISNTPVRRLRTFDDLVRAVTRVSETVKKAFFHGKTFAMVDYVTGLREVWCALRDVCPVETGRSFDAVLQHNVEKLQKRWPNGWLKPANVCLPGDAS